MHRVEIGCGRLVEVGRACHNHKADVRAGLLMMRCCLGGSSPRGITKSLPRVMVFDEPNQNIINYDYERYIPSFSERL